MDEVLTFDEMMEDPEENGLCQYCDLELTGSGPMGKELCEYRCCKDAYEKYAEYNKEEEIRVELKVADPNEEGEWR